MRLAGLAQVTILFLCCAALVRPAAPAQNDRAPLSGQPKSDSARPAAPPGGTGGETQEGTAEKPSSSTAPADSRKSAGSKKKARTKTNPQVKSGNVVVRNGGAKQGETQIAPAISKEQELRDREKVNRLLADTEANLKTIDGRPLTAAQQQMRDQIRTYLAQSKAAADAGDLQRAETLASKAHLLADELAGK